MVRVIIGGILAACVVFAWGMASWMLTPLHTSTLHSIADKDGLVEVMRAQQADTGVYISPPMLNVPDDVTDERRAYLENKWKEAHRLGPIMTVFYSREGSEPMSPETMVRGFLFDWIAGTIAAYILWLAAPSCPSALKRAFVVTLIGIFAAIVSHGAYWNWMHFPDNYTLAMCVDVVVGWGLAGLLLAMIVRPKAVPASAPEAAAGGEQ